MLLLGLDGMDDVIAKRQSNQSRTRVVWCHRDINAGPSLGAWGVDSTLELYLR